MKHLFFVAVASGIFPGTTIPVKAQTNINLEKLVDKPQQKNSPKFIEGIEFRPENSTTILPVEEESSASTTAVASVNTGKANLSFKTIEDCSALQFKYAMLMNMDVESISNVSLYNYIEDWWGTRYRYGGVDRKGIDCSAFAGKLLSAVYGITAPRTAKEQYDICRQLVVEKLAEGDLVFFNTRGGVSHVGLYLGNNYFVHSSVHGGVTINSLTEDYYSRKFISGGRIINQ